MKNKQDVIPLGKTALEVFERTGKIIVPEDMENNDFAVWRCIFQENLAGWQLIAIEEQKKIAIECGNCLKLNPTSKLIETPYFEEKFIESKLRMVAMNCAIQIGRYSKHQADSIENEVVREKWKSMFAELQPKVIKIWFETFKDFPKFGNLIEEYSIYGDWSGDEIIPT